MSARPFATAWLALAPALALAAALAWRMDFLVDDAFISFRYARHFADGHGLVWNIGEAPPVEGFSNFLWVAACALLEFAGLDVLRGSRLISAASALALTALIGRAVLARCPSSRAVSLWSTLAFAALPPIAVWATGGLETMSFALAVFACFDALTRPASGAAPVGRLATLRAGAWAVAAALLRADGLVWVGCALVAAALARSRSRNAPWRTTLAPVLGVALAAALATTAYVLWRHAYFGEWAPNTARVKVHLGALALERGAKYVASLGLAVVWIPLALGSALVVLRRDSTGLAAPTLVFVALGASYVALVGGDWMMMHRMLVPALPFAALALAAGLAALRTPARQSAAGAAALVLGVAPLFDLHPAPRAVRELCHFRWGQEYRSEFEVWRKGVVDIGEWIAVGRALALHTQPGESIVLGNIGAFGYFAENLVVHDTHGLTNKAPLQADSTGRGMPGHDYKVEMAAFDALQPTYLNARIVPRDDPYAVIPHSWRQVDEHGRVSPSAAALARFEFILRPLDAAEGFAPDGALLLIKHRR